MNRGVVLGALCLAVALIASALAQVSGPGGVETVSGIQTPVGPTASYSEITSFAGITKAETVYDTFVGTREIGPLSTAPYDIRSVGTKEIDVPWVGSGVEFPWDSFETYLTETRYHYVASHDPDRTGAVGSISALRQMPADPNSTIPFTTSSAQATFDYEALMAGSDRHLYAASASFPRIDVYDAAVRTDPRFETSLDFSDLIGAENGFSSAVLYTEAEHVLHFGTKRAPAGVATLRSLPDGPELGNFIPFDADAEDVVGMRYSNHRDELYAAVANPPRLYYLKGDLPNADAEVLGYIDLSFARGVPVALTLDRNDPIPQAYVLNCGDEGTEILKFEFGEIGTAPIYVGSYQSDHIRVNTMLHDRDWEYLVYTGVNTATNRREALRVYGGRPGKPPQLVDSQLDTWAFPEGFTDYTCDYSYFHFYAAWPTFPLSNGTSHTTLYTLGFYPRWNAHEQLAATRVSGTFRTPTARATTLNFYSHESGSQVRLAIYDALSDPARAPGNLLWVSEPIPTIDEGWLSVPVDNVPGSIINSEQPLYLAFQTDNNRPIASVARRENGAGARTKVGVTFDSFPEQWSPWTDSNEVFSIYYTFEEEVRLETLTARPVPSSQAADWLSSRSLPIVYTGLGNPGFLDVSETSADGPFVEVPILSGEAVYTLAREGPEYRQLWARARNSFSTSEVMPLSLGLRADFEPPPPPASPEPFAEVTLDPEASFRVYTSDDPPGGSGYLHTVVEVRNAGNGTLLYEQTIEAEAVISVPLSRGVRVHARARSIDKALNLSAWSDWSAIVRHPVPPRTILIHPRTPVPGDELSVELAASAIESDNDPRFYTYRWWHSGGMDEPFQERVDLRGVAQVPGGMVGEGDLWEVRLHVDEAAGSTQLGSDYFAADRVFVGANALPVLSVGQPFGKTVGTRGLSTELKMTIYWDFVEPDGEPCTVDLNWTDLQDFERVPIATGLPAGARRYVGTITVPTTRPIHILVTITDAKGAQVRQLTPAVKAGDLGTLLMAY